MLACFLNLFLQLGLVAVIVCKRREVLGVVIKHFFAHDLSVSLALDIHQGRVRRRHLPALEVTRGLIDRLLGLYVQVANLFREAVMQARVRKETARSFLPLRLIVTAY